MPKQDSLGELIDFGLSALDVVSVMPQKGQVSFAIKTGTVGVKPVVNVLKDLAVKSGNLKLKKLNGVLVENVATAIGKMETLKKFDYFKNVDTWHKSGRIPGKGDKAVTWKENRKWLQERIDRGDTFIMTMDPSKLPTKYVKESPNGWFIKLEYDMLTKQGAKIIHDY